MSDISKIPYVINCNLKNFLIRRFNISRYECDISSHEPSADTISTQVSIGASFKTVKFILKEEEGG